jgi:beta-galactosidase
MFPTKRFDAQMVRTEQYLRHMAVLESAFSSDRISGAIGWCFVDYPTHSNFGSGDGICYHGVCDRTDTRNSPRTPTSAEEKHPVLVSSQTFDAGDTPAMKDLPWVVATNCDFVNLYRDGRFVNTFYPARKEYPHVPHPPVFIDDPIGETITDETKFSAKDQKAIARLLCKSRLSKGTFTLSDKLVYSTLCKRYHLERKDVLELGNRFFGMDRAAQIGLETGRMIEKRVAASEFYGPDQKRVVRPRRADGGETERNYK